LAQVLSQVQQAGGQLPFTSLPNSMRSPLTQLGFALQSANLKQDATEDFVNGVIGLLTPVVTENRVQKSLTDTAVKQAKQLGEQEAVARQELEGLCQKHQAMAGGNLGLILSRRLRYVQGTMKQ
jgi:hypothetical protein